MAQFEGTEAGAADQPMGSDSGVTLQHMQQQLGPSGWGSSVVRYEWSGEEGDLGPENEELEIALFGPPETRFSSGIDFSKIDEIKVVQEGDKRIQAIASFAAAGLHPAMLKNVQMAGFKTPTPIQRYCIPAIGMGHDVIAIAQTGSGKTGAYMIPILNNLMGKAKKLAAPRPSPADFAAGIAQPVRADPLVVVICPTRELAIQIFDQARKLCYRTMLRPCVVYGGAAIVDQIDQIRRGCDVLVGTPGRLVDLMERPGLLSMSRIKYMVVDEADEMLETDWEEQFGKILSGGDQGDDYQLALFSATFPTALRKLAREHLAEDHLRIRVGRVGSTHSNIVQDIVYVEPSQKRRALIDLLTSGEPCRTIIFVNSKRAADEVDDLLFRNDIPVTSMHSDRTQREREDAMRSFRAGTSPILVTTGVTARGIDVHNIGHVINFDLPSTDHGGINEYIHRIGRTGRMGSAGRATSFYSDRDEPLAPLLTLTLMETGQHVPEFLEQYKPEGDVELKFEENTDDEAGSEMGGDGNGEGWGGVAGDNHQSAEDWGGPTATTQATTDEWGSGGGNDTVKWD